MTIFRHRAGRTAPQDAPELFERFFIGLYDLTKMSEEPGAVEGCVFFDVTHAPPKARRLRPPERLDFRELVDEIARTYDERNDPPFEWAED